MSNSVRGRKSIILRLLLLAFAVYSIISLLSLQMQLIELKSELSKRTAYLEETNYKIKESMSLLENGTEAEFIEKAARERLNLVYPDEQIFEDIN
jgi:cell division protein FtsB